MISYYFYGRDPVKGYQSYNKQYTKEDVESCLSKMRNYTVCENAAIGNLPEKIYFYNFKSSKGRCAMVGRTTYNTIADSPMSGDRNTVFVHQYLFQGQDRISLLERPSMIFQVRPFCTRMEDILQKRMSPAQKEYYKYAFDDTSQDVFWEEPERWTAAELLSYFGLEGSRVDELLYTLLNSSRKTYLMLPENTKEATDRARALMRALFGILPPSLMETVGFQTYAFTYDDGIAEHYIPMEIRYVFLANTEKNRAESEQCKKVLRSYIFCDQCSSGAVIPEELTELVSLMRHQLLTGELSQELKWFWDALDRYLKTGAAGSLKEYSQIYRFCRNGAALYEEGSLSDGEEEISEMIHILGERPQIWNGELEKDVAVFVAGLLERDLVTPRFYETVLRLYSEIREDYREEAEAIALYFSGKITDLPSLKHYLDAILAKCPKLRARVLRLVYDRPECYGALAEYELRDVMEDVRKGTKTAQEYMEQLWRKLEQIRAVSQTLVVYVDVLKMVREYVHTALLEQNRTAREVLDGLIYCQKKAEENEVSQAYNYMLQGISEEYIQRKMREPHRKGEEIRVLQTWPASLRPNHEMALQMDSRLQADAVVDKVQNAVLKKTVPELLDVLKEIRSEEYRVLASSESSGEILKAILKLLVDYGNTKGKQKEKEAVFDQMNVELLRLFPKERERILFNIMIAPLGGIPAMSSLYLKTGRNREFEDMRPDMKKAVEDFFRMYEMGRADRKAIRQEEMFLRKIGVHPERLLKG